MLVFLLINIVVFIFIKCISADQTVFFNKSIATPNLILNGNAEFPLTTSTWSTADIVQYPFSNITFKSESMINNVQGLYAYQVVSKSPQPEVSSFQIVNFDPEMYESIDSNSSSYNITANFIRFYSNEDTEDRKILPDNSVIELTFFNSNNTPLSVTGFEPFFAIFNTGLFISIGNLPQIGSGPANSAVIRSAQTTGFVPISARKAKVEMKFRMITDTLISKSLIDNIQLRLDYEIKWNYTSYSPYLDSITRNDKLPLSAYIGIAIGGLGALLLVIVIPFFSIFKRKALPLYRRFTLKRRNTLARLSMRRKKQNNNDSDDNMNSTVSGESFNFLSDTKLGRKLTLLGGLASRKGSLKSQKSSKSSSGSPLRSKSSLNSNGEKVIDRSKSVKTPPRCSDIGVGGLKEMIRSQSTGMLDVMFVKEKEKEDVTVVPIPLKAFCGVGRGMYSFSDEDAICTRIDSDKNWGTDKNSYK